VFFRGPTKRRFNPRSLNKRGVAPKPSKETTSCEVSRPLLKSECWTQTHQATALGFSAVNRFSRAPKRSQTSEISDRWLRVTLSS